MFKLFIKIFFGLKVRRVSYNSLINSRALELFRHSVLCISWLSFYGIPLRLFEACLVFQIHFPVDVLLLLMDVPENTVNFAHVDLFLKLLLLLLRNLGSFFSQLFEMYNELLYLLHTLLKIIRVLYTVVLRVAVHFTYFVLLLVPFLSRSRSDFLVFAFALAAPTSGRGFRARTFFSRNV